MAPEVSLSRAIGPYREPVGCETIPSKPRARVTFRNLLDFYGKTLVPRQTTKVEDHHLSAVRDCLFKIFAEPAPSHYLMAGNGGTSPGGKAAGA